MSRDVFIDVFVKENIPAEIPSTVYDYYRLLISGKKAGLNPEDSYEKVFGEVHEDIDDDAEQLARQLGMELPIETILREWEKPLETLRDMVLWLNWIRQHQTTHK